MSSKWVNSYIGLPWRDKGSDRNGVNCWGLVCLVYREQLGLSLPTYAERFASKDEREEIARIFDGATKEWPWIAVSLWDVREFDVLTFRRGGIDAHVGLVVSFGRMVHVHAATNEVCIERYDDGRWKPRLSGIYRHIEIARAARQ